jgi:hypothetical protein
MMKYVAVNPVGRFHSIDDASGYWTTYSDDTEGGLWIKEDGSENGAWIYDEGSETSGTWWNSDNDVSGVWLSLEDDPMTRYVAFSAVGNFLSIDDTSGYWTAYANETQDGSWIRADGSDRGSFSYDDESEYTGIWWNIDYTSSG